MRRASEPLTYAVIVTRFFRDSIQVPVEFPTNFWKKPFSEFISKEDLKRWGVKNSLPIFLKKIFKKNIFCTEKQNAPIFQWKPMRLAHERTQQNNILYNYKSFLEIFKDILPDLSLKFQKTVIFLSFSASLEQVPDKKLRFSVFRFCFILQ